MIILAQLFATLFVLCGALGILGLITLLVRELGNDS